MVGWITVELVAKEKAPGFRSFNNFKKYTEVLFRNSHFRFNAEGGMRYSP